MATLVDAREVLRGLRREVTETADGTFHVSIPTGAIIVRPDELDEYLGKRMSLDRTAETRLFAPGYYEHAVRFESSIRRRGPGRSNDSVSLQSQDGSIVISLGEVSSVFAMHLADSQTLPPNLRRLIVRPAPSESLSSYLRLTSIRITCAPDTALGRNREKLHELAEAAIFNFAFGTGESISFAQSWDRSFYGVGRKDREAVQFPRRSYVSELVSYYNLALAGDSLVLSYLALYKILEYFFTSTTEGELHRQLSDHLVAPDFSHTKTRKLRDLVKIVRKFDSRANELSALQSVLKMYLGPIELKQWIDAYEKDHGAHFTITKQIFGADQMVDTSRKSVVVSVAKRIYAIRNALVHNKEGEVARFVPYTGQEALLQAEVQLVLFIAEQLIVKTGKDLPY